MSDMLIETGSFGDNSQTNPAWPLDKGSGDRHFDQHIDFARAFRTPPDVQVALTSIDIGNAANARLIVTAENVSATGFDIRFATWADTKVYAVIVNWTAYGV
jgi:hypothetical protein